MPRGSEPKAVVINDPKAIRALAHPARLRAIEALFGNGEALTATQLADLEGISPSAMSYHLRSLERFGIVRRDEDAVDGRERPWRRAGASLHVSPSGPGNARASSNATDVLIATAMERDRERLSAAQQRAGREGEALPLDRVLRYLRSSLLVTPEEASALVAKFDELVEPFLEENRPDAPDSLCRLHVSWIVTADERRPGV